MTRPTPADVEGRDPRVDPRAGDVVRYGLPGYEATVLDVSGWLVSWTYTTIVDGERGACRESVEWWRAVMAGAEVVAIDEGPPAVASLDLTGIRQVLSRATGTGWQAAYRMDVGALLDEVERLRELIKARARGERMASEIVSGMP
jgi:hypothetical protein